ncbi:NUMOD3 domain-containing DNA-binding protein [Flavobacteriaceae bacterium]|nr:NUMOD3 domain-containing DNA-binding protein [Flavobacteriaceae bacterium]
MKRQIPKSEVDKAKKELRAVFTSRIIKNVNSNGCWHLKALQKPGVVDFIVHFSEKGTKKIFFKAKRLAFEYFKGDLEENFAVYAKCEDKYCINPDHHYSSTLTNHLKQLEKDGLLKRREGYRHSPETIAKMSKSQKGKRPNKQGRLKMRLAKLGVNNRSPETIERCAELYYRGEKNATAKLTNEQVLEIRKLEKSHTCHELAELYPVTAKHIRVIWRRRVWKHI